MVYPWSKNLTLIPILKFNMTDGSWKYVKTGTEVSGEDLKDMGFNTGLGLNLTPYENMKVICGGIIGMAKETSTPKDTLVDKGEVTALNMPKIVLGVEAPIRDWLYGRVGMTKSITKIDSKSTPQSGTYKDKATTTTTWNHPFDISYGLGIKLGSFTMDWWIGDEILFQGPYIVSGNPANALQVSLGYNFE